jgi:hypothetical protein
VDLAEVMLIAYSIVLLRSWHWSETVHATVMTLPLVNALLMEANSILGLLGARRIINSFVF